MAEPRPRKLTRLARTVVALSLTLTGLLTLAAVIIATLSAAAPSWWRRMNPRDDATAQTALALENAAVSELTAVRDRGDLWSRTVRDDDASAWLAARFPRWLASEVGVDQWPPELSDLQVRFEPGRLVAAVRLGADPVAPGTGRVVSAALEPRVADDGALWLRASSVRVGRLPLPASWVLALAERRAERYMPGWVADMPETAAFFEVLRGDRPAQERAVVDVGAGRRVRLTGVRVGSGRIELTCKTETPEPVASR